MAARCTVGDNRKMIDFTCPQVHRRYVSCSGCLICGFHGVFRLYRRTRQCMGRFSRFTNPYMGTAHCCGKDRGKLLDTHIHRWKKDKYIYICIYIGIYIYIYIDEARKFIVSFTYLAVVFFCVCILFQIKGVEWEFCCKISHNIKLRFKPYDPLPLLYMLLSLLIM